MFGTGPIRPWHHLTVVDFKCADDVFRRYSILWCRCSLIDDVNPAFALSLCLRDQSGQFRSAARDHGVHELDEGPITRKDARSNSLTCFQRALKNADNSFGRESMLENLVVAQASDVVLRPFGSVHATDNDRQFGHAKILPA